MTVLVTGGLGFLGQTLVASLRDLGERVVDYNRREGFGDDAGHVYVQGELSDLGRLLTAIRDHDVDRIVHTAAMSHPGYSRAMPYTTVQANIVGTTAVLEAARLGGVARVVNLSSEAAYGPQEGDLLREDTLPMPEDVYGATKLTTEHLTRIYGNLYGFVSLSLRVGWIYGPRQKMQCYLHEMLRAAIDHSVLRSEHGGDQRFHYVWVNDVADACVAALRTERPQYDVYNVTGGEEHTYLEVAALVNSLFPDADIQIGPGDLGFYNQPPFDLTRAASDLSFTPSTLLRDGVPNYAAWLRSHQY
jgi:nucleoside-diphosphate-sugar epimerase